MKNSKMSNWSLLIIGLGSMGKRRIRNLKALGQMNIVGFDLRADRRAEAAAKYGIEVCDTWQSALAKQQYDAFVISVPPDKHHIYMKEAVSLNTPFFVEASVVDTDMDEIISQVNAKSILAAPSSTMFFHPAIQRIKSIIESKRLGVITNINYHSGQYLPDWHTYEHVRDFYVSNKETGGAREIVPFELTWLVAVFGFPKNVRGIFRKTIQIEGAENIDDMYVGLFDYGNYVLGLTIDVISRTATRKLLINGSQGQLVWDWNDSFVSVYTAELGWQTEQFEMLKAEEGYNNNITEQMYIDEVNAFLQALSGQTKFINDLGKDHHVLKLLYSLEKSHVENKTVFI